MEPTNPYRLWLRTCTLSAGGRTIRGLDLHLRAGLARKRTRGRDAAQHLWRHGGKRDDRADHRTDVTSPSTDAMDSETTTSSSHWPSGRRSVRHLLLRNLSSRIAPASKAQEAACTRVTGAKRAWRGPEKWTVL